MPTLIGVFLITLPLIVVVGNDDMASLPQRLWLQIAVPLLFTLWFMGRESAKPHRPPRGFGPAVALLLWSALSTFWATDVFASKQILFSWIAAAGLAFLIANTIESGVQARGLLMALFSASVAVSAIGLAQHLGGWNGIPQAFPPAGTLGNKNVAAGFVAVMAPVGVVAFWTATSTLPFLAMAMGLAFAFVLHTGCRAAMVVLMAQSAVALWLFSMRSLAARGESRATSEADLFRQLCVAEPRNTPGIPSVQRLDLTKNLSLATRPDFHHGLLGPRWAPARWGALGIGGGVFLWLSTMTPSASSPVQGGALQLLTGTARPILRFLSGSFPTADPATAPDPRAERSVAIRLGVWSNSLEMIRAAPLAGVGLGNFSVHYPRFAGSRALDRTEIDERVESAHNDYLQLITELGLLGAGLFGWVALVTARAVMAGLREALDPDVGLYVAVGLGLVGLLVLAAVSPVVDQPIALAAFATFAGVALRPGSHVGSACSKDENPQSERTPIFGATLGLIGAAAALVVASFWGFAQIRADRHVLTMAYAEAREDWPAVVREGLLVRRLSPGRVDARFGTASALLRLGQARQAAQMLEELATVDPYNANALGNLAIAYATLGELERAAGCFERVLRLRPDDPFARAELGRIMTRSGVADPR